MGKCFNGKDFFKDSDILLKMVILSCFALSKYLVTWSNSNQPITLQLSLRPCLNACCAYNVNKSCLHFQATCCQNYTVSNEATTVVIHENIFPDNYKSFIFMAYFSTAKSLISEQARRVRLFSDNRRFIK